MFMSKSDLVVKSNRLNSAIQNLTLAELRIIQLAIGYIRMKEAEETLFNRRFSFIDDSDGKVVNLDGYNVLSIWMMKGN